MKFKIIIIIFFTFLTKNCIKSDISENIKGSYFYIDNYNVYREICITDSIIIFYDYNYVDLEIYYFKIQNDSLIIYTTTEYNKEYVDSYKINKLSFDKMEFVNSKYHNILNKIDKNEYTLDKVNNNFDCNKFYKSFTERMKKNSKMNIDSIDISPIRCDYPD